MAGTSSKESIASALAMLEKLPNAIEDVLDKEIKETALDYIKVIGWKNVYSYAATPTALMTRRKENGGLVDPKNFDSNISSNLLEHGFQAILELTNNAPLQHPVSKWNGQSYEYQKLVNVVEKAIPNWNQPYKRFFMKEGRDAAITSGSVAVNLKKGLARHNIHLD